MQCSPGSPARNQHSTRRLPHRSRLTLIRPVSPTQTQTLSRIRKQTKAQAFSSNGSQSISSKSPFGQVNFFFSTFIEGAPPLGTSCSQAGRYREDVDEEYRHKNLPTSVGVPCLETDEMTMFNTSADLSGGVLTSYLSDYGRVEAVTPLRRNSGAQNGNYSFLLCLKREWFEHYHLPQPTADVGCRRQAAVLLGLQVAGSLDSDLPLEDKLRWTTRQK